MAEKASLAQRLWGIRKVARPVLRAQRVRLISCLLLSLCLAFFELLRPQATRLLFDALLLPAPEHLPAFILPIMEWGPWRIVALVVGAVLAISGGIALSNYFLEVNVAYMGNKAVSRLRMTTFRHLIGLPNIFHDSQKTGDLVVRLTGDILMVRDLMVDFLVNLATRTTLLVGMVAVMFLMNWQLTLLVAAFIPGLFWLTYWTTGRVNIFTRKQRRNESEVAHAVHEIIGEMRAFALYGRKDLEEDRFDSSNRSSFKQDVKGRKLRARLAGVTELSLGLGSVAVILAGMHEILAGRMSAGELLVFLSYLRTMYKPIRSMTGMVSRTGKAVACAERVLEILETPPVIQDEPGATKAPEFRGEIEWRNVSLTYGGKSSALRGINLRIDAGSIVGISGHSGSGKSSLCMVVPRLYDPDEGEVLIDGQSNRRFKLESLRSRIGFVLQEPGIFDLSIAENVSFGLEECSPEAIEQACREAELHETVAAMPQGYDSPVGERGSLLSGGQRRRLAIARALVRKPRILILDEPYEALDAETACAIRDTILRLAKGRTIIIISHHAQHLEGCTRLIHMRRGTIVKDEEAAGTRTDSPAVEVQG